MGCSVKSHKSYFLSQNSTNTVAYFIYTASTQNTKHKLNYNRPLAASYDIPAGPDDIVLLNHTIVKYNSVDSSMDGYLVGEKKLLKNFL